VKLTLRILAVALLVAANGWWLAAGANRGWTKTQVPITTLDEVTGLTGIAYENKFVPGLDVLGLAWLGAAVLAGASLYGRNAVHPKTHTRT
jgi:hypothetical protein